jgi:hypothetical protein
MLASEVLIDTVILDGEVTVDADELEDWRSVVSDHGVVQVVNHIPAGLDVYITSVQWQRVVGPVGRIRPKLQGSVGSHIEVDLLEARVLRPAAEALEVEPSFSVGAG